MHTDFISSMITPIIKAVKQNQKLSFYTMNEYNNWKETCGSGWNVKYYKGLGTSSASEAKEYFKDIKKHTVIYSHTEEDNNTIDLAFRKSRADERKQWIQDGLQRSEIIDNNIDSIGFTDFINKDLIWFSIADVTRSIASVVDGLKPSQRKVLYACRKRSNKEVKVSQLSGYISTETSYHHGEQSLMKQLYQWHKIMLDQII